MESRKRTWTVGIIIAAIIIFGLILFCNRGVDRNIDQQGKDVIEDLTID